MAAQVGQVTEFLVSPAPNGTLVRGSDGNLWFGTSDALSGKSMIGRVTPTGQITQFADPNGGGVAPRVLGPDGNVWFFESTAPLNQPTITRIGRITPAGQISEFLVPDFKGNRDSLNTMTVGSDGNLWFTANTFVGRGTLSNGFIGRVTTAGVVTEFGTPTAVSDPVAIAVGSDGNVWFTEAVGAIGRITTH